MKKIIRLAFLELSILFYSPIAWLILIIFIVQSGISFAGLVLDKEASQQLGSNLESLTTSIFSGREGFFAAIQNKLYLYMPLLTMGLMSREIHSGSIKLLLSSPLTSRQIILGKFLSTILYGGLFISVLGLIIIAGAFSIKSLDFSLVFGGLLGLYLLICAYAAIGLFMSSLTSYQVVAAISTLAVFAALNFIGSVGQAIELVRDITYWISIDGRADNFINGLISSKDVIYFLLVIVLFLILSIMKLEEGRKVRSSGARAMKYTAFISAVIFFGYLSSLPSFTAYLDTTRFKKNTLTANSQKLIDQLEHPVSITTYTNVVNAYAHLGAPKLRNFDLKQFESYRRYLPGLKMDYIAYYDTTMRKSDATKTLEEKAQRAATAHGYDFNELLTPLEIKKQINLIPEENFFVRTLNYNGKKVFLRMYFDMVGYPEEAEISAALKKLLTKPAYIGVLDHNDERSISKAGDNAYMDILNTNNTRRSLINQGFELERINLSVEGEIPDSLTLLLIADPITPYTGAEVDKINRYISKGGNLLLSAEPGKQKELNKILKTFGVELAEGTLLQESKDFEPDLLQSHLTVSSKELGINLPKETIISMPGTAGLKFLPDSSYKYLPVLTANNVTTAIALTRKVGGRTQKIFISGDADFMSNSELKRSNIKTENAKFTTQLFNWFSDGAYPVDTSRPSDPDNRILVTKSQISAVKTFFLLVLPAVLALLGAYILIRRKRQ